MEAQNEPKPKRKYVMTPEGRAKLLANLAQARLAPKDKVYRKTPKRYAANLNNLGIASAKRRREAETLHQKMEDLFPPPEVPPLPIPPPPLRPLPTSGAANGTAGAEEFEQATRLIAKRLRKVHAAVRREGRRIMRLLTVAIARSQPLTANEAVDLAKKLLQCLDRSRLTVEARRLNKKIARLLSKMIETRYGAEAQVGGFALETVLEQLRQERRQRGAERRARRAARQAQRAQEIQEDREGSPVTPGDTGEGGPASPAEGRKERAGDHRGQVMEPSIVSVPKLPDTFEEFQGLVARALDLEATPTSVGPLAARIWERIHLWEVRAEMEAEELEEIFREAAANPPGAYPDFSRELRDRAYKVPLALKLDDDFLGRMDQLTARVEESLLLWLCKRPSIPQRELPCSQPPAQPPVKATSDQPVRGLADLSAIA